MFHLFKGFPEAPVSRSVVNSFPQACEAACMFRGCMLHFGAREPLSPFTKGAGLACLSGSSECGGPLCMCLCYPRRHRNTCCCWGAGGLWWWTRHGSVGASSWVGMRDTALGVCSAQAWRCFYWDFPGGSERRAGSWALASLPAFLAYPPGWCEPEPWSLHLWNGKWNFPL